MNSRLSRTHSPHSSRTLLPRAGAAARSPELLIRATLRCRLCTRPVGDVVGYPSRPLAEARFVPLPTGAMPAVIGRGLRCSRCHGQLELDDIEELVRTARLSEAGGISVGDVLSGAPKPSAASAA